MLFRSLGGMLGMWMGIHAPDRIDRLVLCNTAAVMPPPSMWDERIETVLGDGMGAIADGVLDRWFTTPFRVCSRDEVRRIGDMLLATSPVGYAGCCAAIRDMDQRSGLEAIHQEVLIIAGRDDPATPVARAEEIKRHVPQARLVVLDQCAHLSNIEQREAFNRAILPFVSGSLERQADRRW